MTFKISTHLLLFSLAIVLVSGENNSAWGQNWQVNQSPVVSVPQYVPRYPLTEPIKPVSVPTTPTDMTVIKKSPVAPQPTPKVMPKVTPKPKAKPKPKTVKKSVSSKNGKDKAKKKPKTPPHYGVDYTIYRDQNIHPIDPRKPNNVCVRPCGNPGCGSCARRCRGCSEGLPGVGGRPYMEHEPGGCTCQKKHPTKHPQFNLHWPRPFSARLDERFPNHAAERYQPCQKERVVDIFNHLSTFKLSKYKRSDSGYSGIGSDPYGCLGESKQMSSQVMGVGYRFPSEPVDRGLNIGSYFMDQGGQVTSRVAEQSGFGFPLIR